MTYLMRNNKLTNTIDSLELCLEETEEELPPTLRCPPPPPTRRNEALTEYLCSCMLQEAE